MKDIVSISLGTSGRDYDFATTFLGQAFRIRRFGTDGNLRQAQMLLRSWDGRAHAIGLGVARDARCIGGRTCVDERIVQLEQCVRQTSLTTGAMLRGLLHEWAIRRVQADQRGYFNNARVLFTSGLDNYRSATVLSDFTRNLRFADPILDLGVPKLLGSMRALERYGAGVHSLQRWVPAGSLASASARVRKDWNRYVLRKAMQASHVLLAPMPLLERCAGLEELAGKTVLTCTVSDARLRWLRDQGVEMVLDGSPQLLERVVSINVLEAVILAALNKSKHELTYDDLLSVLEELKAEPRVLYPSGRARRTTRYAFVIHPLSQEYFKAVKPIEVLSKVTPPVFMNALEKVMAYAPPFVYSPVSAVESPTGSRAEGWLISVGGTPKELLAHSPEFTYRRLLAAARMAERLGAQIMGLGAFTKVVGDAGVTVARRARIPITTGNSYSASGALWAAADAARRMGLIPLDHKSKIQGKAMVIGATGAIGSVCTRLLAQAVREVVLVSPETAKLLALKDSILNETPDAKLHLATRADDNLRDMDLIVTATSGAGQRVLDIMKVKPGCIITDVARPLDLPPSEVAKRPDVLVIESGEIQLPCAVDMKYIGLPRGIVYACLAETIVLALEGRFECFTVGRHIEWEKVKEIYKLGLKHGMRLAAISGVNGVYSDADIRRVRELALKARAAMGITTPAATSEPAAERDERPSRRPVAATLSPLS